MTGRDNYEYMTAGSVPRTICELAVPTIISMLVSAIYNVADTYFVGNNVKKTGFVAPVKLEDGLKATIDYEFIHKVQGHTFVCE